MQVLDIETLLEADADGDNSVDKNEFVLFRLGQMGLIPQALRLRAEQQFDRMDLGMSNVSMSQCLSVDYVAYVDYVDCDDCVDYVD
tara:strand:- start:66 stop:323 length:258 start_codon:yes stop_codon:yes gene_type:complete